jgi:hypothetical protein
MFLGWWWLRWAHTIVRVGLVGLQTRTFLPIFCADSRSVQHPRGGLGDAFGTDARAMDAAGRGEICTSRPMRGKPEDEYWDMTSADLSFLCCSRIERFARL